MAKQPNQLNFKIKTWGGKRRGAGRPNQSGQRGHLKRELVNRAHPVHITWRLKAGLKSLRSEEMLAAFEDSCSAVQLFGARVIHFSLQSNHLHFLVEARDGKSLSRALKSMGCRFGKAVRKASGGRGSVFADRYHIHTLKTPTEMKRAMVYVLQNSSKHRRLIPHVDRYSSAPHFHDWRRLLGTQQGPVLEDVTPRSTIRPGFLGAPKSWLAREGWRRARLSRDRLRRSTL